MKTIVLLSVMLLSLIGFSQTSNEKYQTYLSKCNTSYLMEAEQSGHLINGDTIWTDITLEYFYSNDPVPFELDLYDHNPNHWVYRKKSFTIKLCKPVTYEIWVTNVVYIRENGVLVPWIENGVLVGYDKLLSNLETNIKL